VAVIRDFAVILLALLNIVLIAIMVVIAWQLWRLVKVAQRELPQFVGTAKETLTTVQGTTAFLGAEVAKPAIGALSFVAAVRRFFSVIFRANNGREVRQ
jgi:hypothetical protein